MRGKEKDLYKFILKEIDERLKTANQWEDIVHSGYRFANYVEARGLIEVLETYNCGSVGGFDKGQKDRSLKGRIKWLKDKRKESTR